jgi:hypothetical protein
VPITYRLRTLDNEDAGTFATTLSDWRPRMELIGHRNRRFGNSCESATEIVAPARMTRSAVTRPQEPDLPRCSR